MYISMPFIYSMTQVSVNYCLPTSVHFIKITLNYTWICWIIISETNWNGPENICLNSLLHGSSTSVQHNESFGYRHHLSFINVSGFWPNRFQHHNRLLFMFCKVCAILSLFFKNYCVQLENHYCILIHFLQLIQSIIILIAINRKC